MKPILYIAVFFAVSTVCLPAIGSQTKSATGGPHRLAPAHVSNTFRFQVNASLAQAAPLFGAEGERIWAGTDWNPVFLYPQPGKATALDTQGAVFTVQHGPHTSIWINTAFDLAAGRMQYVSLIPGHMISIVDVRLTAIGPLTTGVEVTFARTALNPSANEAVTAEGSADTQSGPEWQQAIEAGLKAQEKKAP